MRKIFVDIGTHNGQTILQAIDRFPDLDDFIGVEPVKSLCDMAMDRVPELYKGRVYILNIALDYQKEPVKKVKFFEDVGRNNKLGSSLLPDKKIGKKKVIEIECWDIRKFWEQFEDDDKIILKVDIEGKEYDLFKGMIKHDLLKNVQQIYCEWHWNKVNSITEEQHWETVKKLNQLGFSLKGISKYDEFYGGKG